MPGIQGQSVFKINSQGIRGREFSSDEDEYRILAIGGSTTQCGYLDEKEAWPSYLEGILGTTVDNQGVWVGNIGKAGKKSRDHYLQLKHLVPQYRSIDAVIMLVGVNDLISSLKQGDHYVLPEAINTPTAQSDQIRSAFMITPGGPHESAPQGFPWFKKTAIWQLARRAKDAVILSTTSHLAQDPFGENLVAWRKARQNSQKISNLPDMRYRLIEYRRTLSAIAELSEKLSIRLIFATQPALWKEKPGQEEESSMWLGGVGEFRSKSGLPYYSAEALYKGMNMYNKTLLSVCEEYSLECVDLAASIPADLSMFYDDVHFTERGSAKVAELLGEHIMNSPPRFSNVGKYFRVIRVCGCLNFSSRI